MSHQSELIATDIHEYLAQHERKDLLRFLTCGSVDDGKSTLIGRLLHDSKMIYEDQLAAIEADSVTHGTTGGEVDLALLMDGLKAEREQGITIDVAYRYFSTAKRKFIIADTPGHEQYTRNMATGASTCDLAVILVDARHGVVVQTKRHSFIVSLLGIRHVVVAVNKMDLVDFDRATFDRIVADYRAFATKLDVEDVVFVPISALEGDNVVEASPRTPWYDGPTLMHHLEEVEVEQDRNLDDFRFPVQLVLRPNLDFRGFAGTVASGLVAPGDDVVALPSGKRSRVERVVTYDGDLDVAGPGQAVTLTLADEIDVSRGDVLAHPGNVPKRGHHVDAMLVWMNEKPMVPGRQYIVRQATKVSNGAISTLHHRVDVNTLETKPAPALELNEIGRVTLSADQELLYDPYARNRTTGAFVLVEKLSNATVGAGMIIDDAEKGLWDAEPKIGLRRELSEVTPGEREARYGQKPATVLLTGLAGAGKSTIAKALERRLFEAGRAVTVLDGQTMRVGLSKDLGFSAADRSENLRRACEVARVMNDAGLVSVLAFIAASNDVRDRARRLVGPERFVLVHLDAPLEVCRERDPGHLYARAEAGVVPDFPGVSLPFDPPVDADLVLRTDELDVVTCVERVVDVLVERGVLPTIPGGSAGAPA